MNFRRNLFIRFAWIVLFALPCSARAGGIGNDIIALFPKNTGEFAYANLKKARTLPWFSKLQEQMVPERFRQFEQLMASAGVDPNTQVDEIAWGLVAPHSDGDSSTGGSGPSGEQIVGVALGNFQPDSAAQFFKAQKLPTFKSHGYTLYAFGTGAGPNDLFFFFIDSNTAAFGQRSELENLIAIRYGEEEGLLRSDRLFPLINEANGSGAVWAVLDPSYTRLAISQLAPDVQAFPDAQKLISRMQSLIITMDSSGSGVDGHFQAVCGSTEDANTLGQLLQAGFLYERYQESQKNPDLAQLLDQVQVTPAGDRVDLRMSLTDDQMSSLIRRNTFVLKM
jgi:hypothetical protein